MWANMDKLLSYLVIFFLVVSFVLSLIFFRFGVSLIVAAFIFVFWMMFFKKGLK